MSIDQFIVIAACLGAGFALGFLIGKKKRNSGPVAALNNDDKMVTHLKAEKMKMDAELSSLAKNLEAEKIQNSQLDQEKKYMAEKYEAIGSSYSQAVENLDRAHQKLNDILPKYAILEKENSWLKDQTEMLKNQFLQIDKNLTDRISALAQKVTDDQSKKIQEFGLQNIGGIITPLKEQITSFEKQIHEAYGKESKERTLLQQRVQDLISAQSQLSNEANRLSSALRSDSKLQGNWGEIVLKRIIEKSGLIEGLNYIEEGKDLGLTGPDGKAQLPDLLIKLEDEKHLIVDSKVTIRSFESYIHAENEQERDKYWSDYEKAIEDHIKGLKSKFYHTNKKLKSPEYVLMFIPTEASYALLLEKSKDLVEEAWANSIIPVGPTNLMACLKAVDTVWKFNRQSKNVEEIIEISTKALKKFTDFTLELDTIGDRIVSVQDAFDQAKTKLKGKGGCVSLMQKIEKLGVPSPGKMGKVGDEGNPEDDEAA